MMDRYLLRPLVCSALLQVSLPALLLAQPGDQKRAEDVVVVRLGGNELPALSEDNVDPLLQSFLEEHPEHPLQQWSQGKIWTGEEWLPFAKFAEQGNRWHEIYRYRKERAKRRETLRDQLFLADGCREHKLYREERAHLVQVLLADYGFDEAHLRLGHINVGGFWSTPRQILTAARKQYRTKQNLETWTEPAQRLLKNFQRTKPGSLAEAKMAERLMEIRTPDAIPALERYFATHSPRTVWVFQDWLASIDSHEAAEALVRQGLHPADSAQRTRANKLLRERSYDQYVPYLMSGLTTVSTQMDTQLLDLNFGLATHALWSVRTFQGKKISKQVTIDSLDARVTHTSVRRLLDRNQIESLLLFTRDGANFPLSPIYALRPTGVTATGMTLHEILMSTWASSSELMLQDYGTQLLESTQQVRKDRLMRTLTTITDETFKTPEDCFDWWKKQNELVQLGGKFQIDTTYDEGIWYVDRRSAQQVRPVRVASCFIAGTPVTAERGLVPIEDLQVGDVVLAQDVETGELNFKPVLTTTRFHQPKTLRIQTASEEIRCSLGHPFWISGAGWRMAKDLEPGLMLTTLSGHRVEILTIEEAEAAEVFNLIVADFSTYFAGQSRFLTHDVRLRGATDMALPGIRRSFE